MTENAAYIQQWDRVATGGSAPPYGHVATRASPAAPVQGGTLFGSPRPKPVLSGSLPEGKIKMRHRFYWGIRYM